MTAGVSTDAGQPPSAQEFCAEADVILREGLAGVALRGMESDPEWREDPIAFWLYNAAMNGQVRCMRVDHAGAKLLAIMQEQQIPFAVIKGPSMAALHPFGWPRSYSDIDIVTPAPYFRRAVAAATSLRYVHSDRSVPQWQWFDTYCREGINMHGPAGGNIDIHHHFPPWVLTAKFPPGHVIDRSVPGELSGVSTRFGGIGDQLVVASLHILNDLWKGKLGLASWRDVIVLLNLIEVDGAIAAFELAGLSWLLDTITEALERHVPESDVIRIRAVKDRSILTKWRLKTLGWSSDSVISRHRLSWAMRLPAINGVAYAAGVAFPSRAYIRDRHGTLLGYWKEGLAETLKTIRGADYRMTTVQDKEPISE